MKPIPLLTATALGLLALAPAAEAQICGRRDGCGNPAMDFRVPRGSGGGADTYVPDPAEQARTQAAALEIAGLQALERGEYDAAMRLLDEASSLWPENPQINERRKRATGLRYNKNGLGALERGDHAAAAAHFETALIYQPDDPDIRANLNAARSRQAVEEAARREREKDAHDRQRATAALDDLAGRLQQQGAAAPVPLPSRGTRAPPAAGDPNVVDARGMPGAGAGPSAAGGKRDAAAALSFDAGDTRVVDARNIPAFGSGLPRNEEIERSPAVGEARKGLQAVANSDWPVALAWYQTALRKDPGNASLQRAVDISQYMVEVRERQKAKPTPFDDAITAWRHGNMEGALRELEIRSMDASIPRAKERADAWRG